MSFRFLRWSIFGGLAALLIGVSITTRDAAKLQDEVFATLENRFGFTSEVITLNRGESDSKVVVIHPLKNGILYSAGFRDGDQLLSFSKYRFYGLLNQNKGSSVSIDVMDHKGIAKTIVLDVPG